MVIELEDLSIYYGVQQVLKNISFQVESKAVGMLGPNGAGKTTLIRTLLGFLKPTQGWGSVLGLDISTRQSEIRQRIGYMPENDCFVSGMNAVTFVAYAGELCGLPHSDAIQRAHEVLQYVGLGEARYRVLDTYSTGMKQRLKLAQALVHDPELVLLDEPTNGMDPPGRLRMLDLIRDISYDKGIHTILSSHLLPDVEYVCQEVIVIHQGRVVMQSEMAELKQNTQKRFDVKVRGPHERFTHILDEYGYEWRPLKDEILRIALPENISPRVFFEIAVRNNMQIRYLRRMEHSLEDIFAQAVGET